MDDRRVLLVDDDQSRPKILAELRALGYEVIELADGFAALEYLENGTNDIEYVLCGINVTGLSGKQLIRQIRSKGIPDFVFVLMIENPDTNTVKEIALAGADGVLAKPYEPESIGRILQSAKRRQEDKKLASYIKNIS